MTTNVQKRKPNAAPFAPLVWFAATALLGLLATLLSAHSLFLYWLMPLTGLLIGLAQWRLLRPHTERAWRWVGASTGGWILGLLLTVGVLYALGFILVGRMGNMLPAFSLGLVKTMEVFAYTAIFGIMGAVQAIPLRRMLPTGAGRWVLWSAIGGTLLGLMMQVTCSVGGVGFVTSRLLLDAPVDNTLPFCINPGITLPRLQTNDPAFYIIPLSWAAHAIGWTAYAGVSAFAMRGLLRQNTD